MKLDHLNIGPETPESFEFVNNFFKKFYNELIVDLSDKDQKELFNFLAKVLNKYGINSNNIEKIVSIINTNKGFNNQTYKEIYNIDNFELNPQIDSFEFETTDNKGKIKEIINK